MSVRKAKDYYTGKDGRDRLNCAQAMIAAYRGKFSLGLDAVELFASHGGGKAPHGECGALCAAKFLLKDKHHGSIKECESLFLSHAGSTKCKEIRKLNKLPCLGCIEKAAEFVDNI